MQWNRWVHVGNTKTDQTQVGLKDTTRELAIQNQIWAIRFIREMDRASTVMVINTPEGPAAGAASAKRKVDDTVK